VGERASPRAFLAISALLFAASAALTISWCTSTPDGEAMPVPQSALCGGTSLGAAASFLVMWSVMMAAMMLPSLVPMLWRYRDAVRETGSARLEMLTALVGGAYFAVWMLSGVLVYALSVTLPLVMMQIPASMHSAPLATGAIIVAAGLLQLTPWKAHHLAGCSTSPGRLPADVAAAWRHGWRLGRHCVASSAGLTATLLVTGMMDLRAMAVVTALITLERLAPAGEHIARAIGGVIAIAGLSLIVCAAGLG
jgi:predicted metal-binding membrane protein